MDNLEHLEVPSGKPTENYGKSHHFQWVNPLEMVIFNSYMLNYQRVNPIKITIFVG